MRTLVPRTITRPHAASFLAGMLGLVLAAAGCTDAAPGAGADGAVGADAGAGDRAMGDGAPGDGPDAGGPDAAPTDGGDADAGGADGPPTCPAGFWCSQLYPPTWTPAAPADGAGRFLHDFSFAGYQHGEPPPDAPPGAVFDVVAQFGADPAGTSDATAAIQAAIGAATAANGGIVFLPAGTYRCDGLLAVTASNVVLRGAGPTQTKVYFTRATTMSDLSSVTFRGQVQRGPDVPLAQDGANRSRDVLVADAAGLAVGDEVGVGWVITDEFVAEHGMTGVWQLVGQWKPFFRRTIVAIDAASTPTRVTLDVPLRYPAKVRDQASLRRESGYLGEGGIEHLALSNAVAWDAAWSSDRAHVLGLQDARDCWVRDVHSFASPVGAGFGPADTTAYHLQSGGIVVIGSKRVTITASTMQYAQNRGGGGNGYLFEVSRSNEVLVVDSTAHRGRHNFIQNWDFGTTGCVFLRLTSTGSQYATMVAGVPFLTPAKCEYHHALALANLVDQSSISDGWMAVNRGAESSGAGHAATQNAFWNTRGGGQIVTRQFGWGYVIGTSGGVVVTTSLGGLDAVGTAPEDFVEGAGSGDTLWPPSLYEDQRARRLGL